MNPLTEFVRGFRAFIRGLGWLKNHPRYLAMLMIPFLLGMILLSVAWTYLFSYHEQIAAWVMFAKPESWYGIAFFYVAQAMLYVSLTVLSLVVVMLTTNVISIPIYELVSVAVERDLTGKSEEISIWESVRLIPEELKRMLFILAVSIVVLFVPVLNVVSFLVTAFLIGWDLYDLPMARRGWRFGERLRLVGRDGFAVAGFGMWLVIPVVQFFLMPFAVAGGSMLAIEHMQKRNLSGGENLRRTHGNF